MLLLSLFVFFIILFESVRLICVERSVLKQDVCRFFNYRGLLFFIFSGSRCNHLEVQQLHSRVGWFLDVQVELMGCKGNMLSISGGIRS